MSSGIVLLFCVVELFLRWRAFLVEARRVGERERERARVEMEESESEEGEEMAVFELEERVVRLVAERVMGAK